MMTNMTQYGVNILILLVESLLLVSPGLICPEISYLGGPAQLICTGGTLVHTYYNTGGKVATCGLTLNSSCDSTDMSAYRLSSNQTALNITSVQISDAGTWVCKNARNSNTSCHLTIANIPTYSITSDNATDAVDVYDWVSLTVDIWDFYCSAAHNLTLQVGSVTQPLNMYLPEAVTEPTNFTISINITESHFGDVELIFLCNGQQLNVSHRSVTQLQQNISTKVSVPKTPTCNITSDKDTETLTLYEEVTLTVDIAAYYDIRGSFCSVDSNFTLQTGDVTQLLNVAGTGADHDFSPITFDVTETHLGGVRLIFYCQHKHWNFTCDGVTELNYKTKTAAVPGNAGLYTAFTPIIAASVVGAIVCFINAVIVIVFLVKRKQVSMMTNMTQYGVHILILLVESLLLVSPGLICPEISYLGGPVQLFCTGGTLAHTYYNTGGKVATCGLTAKSSCTSSKMSAYRLSSNQTGLNITRAQKSDAGKWTCSSERNSNTSCNLTIAKGQILICQPALNISKLILVIITYLTIQVVFSNVEIGSSQLALDSEDGAPARNHIR
ncbi:uncharacterized protein LOC124150159 [Haliotis rufescens]|uniref:uncharacterized protein LOC124150159 n=1 Tax=Haliotis rufescens TaxID=6454 RepID=UPI00201F8787|nr:uncharacterized protein LOC124150159 [Haliotis rufescens]